MDFGEAGEASMSVSKRRLRLRSFLLLHILYEIMFHMLFCNACFRLRLIFGMLRYDCKTEMSWHSPIGVICRRLTLQIFESCDEPGSKDCTD